MMKRTASATIPKNAVGVWYLPSLPMFVPLYSPKKGVKGAQDIVDDKYSAAYMNWGIGHLIADHVNSKHGARKWKVNEWKLNDKAFLFLPNDIRRYVLTGLLRVKVEGSKYTHEGLSVFPRQSADILCVCCVEEGPKENYLAYFRFDGIEEEE